mgnify:FL=1
MEEVLVQNALGTLNTTKNKLAERADLNTCHSPCFCDLCGDRIPPGVEHLVKPIRYSPLAIIRICIDCTGLPITRALRDMK